MVTKDCGVLGLIAAAMMFMWTLNYASAADFVEITRQVKLDPKPPVNVTTSSQVTGKVQFNQKFSSITNIGFRFTFVGDLLDPGDEVAMDLSKDLRTLAAAPGQNAYSIGIALRDIGKVYYREGCLKEARSYFEQVKEKLSATDAARILAEGLFEIGQEYTEHGDHNEALIAYQVAC